jgi:hypothetical protein
VPWQADARLTSFLVSVEAVPADPVPARIRVWQPPCPCQPRHIVNNGLWVKDEDVVGIWPGVWLGQ